VIGQDLGLDEGTPYGVMCALQRPEGPGQPTFFVVPRRSVYEPDPSPPLPPGFQVRDITAPGAPPLGRVVAVIQTDRRPCADDGTITREALKPMWGRTPPWPTIANKAEVGSEGESPAEVEASVRTGPEAEEPSEPPEQDQAEEEA
jgi:hypothetical protein